jgi:hypothetical protein
MADEFTVFFRHGMRALVRMREVFHDAAWSFGAVSLGRSIILVYQRRVSINFHWRPLYCFSAILPSVGTLTVLQVPLAVFKKFFHSVRTSHLVYKVEISELARFRDAIVDFYDDFALLVKAGFPCPASDDLQPGFVTFRADFGWQIVATIDPDGITVQGDAVALFTRVSRRFRDLFGRDRRMLRRAAQLLIAVARFEQMVVAAVCEILAQLQREGWAEAIDWQRFFDDAKVSPDGNRIAVTIWTPIDVMDLELVRGSQKLQIVVGTQAGHRMFAAIRGLIQWLAESDPGTPWAI